MIVVVFLFIYFIFIFKWPLLSHSKLNKIEKMALSIKRLELYILWFFLFIFYMYFVLTKATLIDQNTVKTLCCEILLWQFHILKY